MQKPSLGRILVYTPHANDQTDNVLRDSFGKLYGDGRALTMSALITYVVSDTLVNVTVFDPHGGIHGRHSIELVPEGALGSGGAYVQWPQREPPAGANAHGLGPDTDGGPNPNYKAQTMEKLSTEPKITDVSSGQTTTLDNGAQITDVQFDANNQPITDASDTLRRPNALVDGVNSQDPAKYSADHSPAPGVTDVKVEPAPT